MFYYINDAEKLLMASERPPRNMEGLVEITEEEYNQIILLRDEEEIGSAAE